MSEENMTDIHIGGRWDRVRWAWGKERNVLPVPMCRTTHGCKWKKFWKASKFSTMKPNFASQIVSSRLPAPCFQWSHQIKGCLDCNLKFNEYSDIVTNYWLDRVLQHSICPVHEIDDLAFCRKWSRKFQNRSFWWSHHQVRLSFVRDRDES